METKFLPLARGSEARLKVLADRIGLTVHDIEERGTKAISLMDQATNAGDVDGVVLASKQLRDLVATLNHTDGYGCMANESRAGCVLASFLAAPVGVIPKAGQGGLFLHEFNHVRMAVEVNPLIFGSDWAFYAIHAIDPHRPFFSVTGYRAIQIQFGNRSPLSALDAELQRIKPVRIREEYSPNKRVSLLGNFDCVAPYEDESGQMAFF